MRQNEGGVAFVAQHDSELKWAQSAAGRLSSAFECRLYRIGDDAGFGADPAFAAVRAVRTIADLPFNEMRRFGAVVAILGGGDLERLAQIFLAKMERTADDGRGRPVLMAGYTGLILDGYVGGLSFRALYDFIIVNGPADLAIFERLGSLFPSQRLLGLGLPFLSRSKAEASAKRKIILFADQPTVPPRSWERRYVFAKLLELADAHPDKEIVLKNRYPAGVSGFHKEALRYEDLLMAADESDRRPNLAVSDEPIGHLFKRSALVLTVSSTAAVEAMSLGTPVGIISDFGLKENLGTSWFVDSGCLATFDEIIAGRRPSASEAWIERHLFRDQSWPEAFQRAMAEGPRSDAAMSTPYHIVRRKIEERRKAWPGAKPKPASLGDRGAPDRDRSTGSASAAPRDRPRASEADQEENDLLSAIERHIFRGERHAAVDLASLASLRRPNSPSVRESLRRAALLHGDEAPLRDRADGLSRRADEGEAGAEWERVVDKCLEASAAGQFDPAALADVVADLEREERGMVAVDLIEALGGSTTDLWSSYPQLLALREKSDERARKLLQWFGEAVSSDHVSKPNSVQVS